MTLDQIIRDVQSSLSVDVDGKAGPETWSAIHDWIVSKTPAKVEPVPINGKVDARSEKNIATLLPEVQPYARALVQKAAAIGITIKVISALRTYEEQDALFAKRPKVTNARGGYSNHNFGIAFDIGIFDSDAYIPDSPRYKVIGTLGVELGLEWGGNWKSIIDEPHFQLRPKWAKAINESSMLAELRKRKAAGVALF